MLLTLAVRLALSRHIDYRWRQVALVTGWFLGTVLLLGASVSCSSLHARTLGIGIGWVSSRRRQLRPIS